MGEKITQTIRANAHDIIIFIRRLRVDPSIFFPWTEIYYTHSSTRRISHQTLCVYGKKSTLCHVLSFYNRPSFAR